MTPAALNRHPRHAATQPRTKPPSQLLEYTAILLLIYLSGNIYFMSFNYQIAVLATLFTSCIMLLWRWTKGNAASSTRNTLQLATYTALTATTILINPSASMNSHLAVLAQIVIAAAVAGFLSSEEFMYKAGQLMSLLALTSLVFFAVGLVNPAIVELLPHTLGTASVDYYNAGVYVYMSPTGYSELTLTTRNNGIFWEPGAYQAFLNIGLFYLLDERLTPRFGRGRGWRVAVLIIAIITTFSIMGYVVMIATLVVQRRSFKATFRQQPILLSFLIIIAAFSVSRWADSFDLAFLKYFDQTESILSRVSLDRSGLIGDSWTEVIFGTGLNNSTDQTTIWNSILHTASTQGLIFTLILIVNYYRGATIMTRHGTALFLILVMCFLTESLIWRPFFLYIAFASIAKDSIAKDASDPSRTAPLSDQIAR